MKTPRAVDRVFVVLVVTLLCPVAAMARADAYQVRLYGPDFGEIYRSANTAAASMTVDRASLPPGQSSHLDLTWRVFALSQGDVIATSAPGSIRTR